MMGAVAGQSRFDPLTLPGLMLIIAATAAWSLLFLGGGSVVNIPVLCTGRLLGRIPGGSDLEFALAWLSPSQILAGWGLMIIAMMLPMLSSPIAHVRMRSFQHHRVEAALAFLLGYLGVWLVAAIPLIFIVLMARLSGGDAQFLFITALCLMLCWQWLPLIR